MQLGQGDQVVQTLAPQGPNDPLAKAIREGTPVGAFQDTQSQFSDRFIQIGRKDTVSIMNEVSVGMIRWDCFAKLLLRPCRRWVVRDMDVHQLSCCKLNDYKHIEALESCRDHGQNIIGNNCLGVISHKGGPALIATRLSLWAFGHVLTNGTR
jgi:hypothetical protein